MIDQVVSASTRVKQEKETLDAMIESRRKKLAEIQSAQSFMDGIDDRIRAQQTTLNDAIAALKKLLG